MITLPPYGFFWFQLGDSETEPDSCRAAPSSTTLVVGRTTGMSLLQRTRARFEHDVLPPYLPARRWFADKARRSVIAPRSSAAIPLATSATPALAGVRRAGERATETLFPAADDRWDALRSRATTTRTLLAAVRRGPREGTLLDVADRSEFHRAAAARSAPARRSRRDGQRLEFRPTSSFPAGRSGSRSDSAPRTRAVEHHGAGRLQLRGQDLSPARRRHQSRDRGRPLSHRRRGFRQCTRRCSAAWSWSRASAAARSPSSIGFVENQGDAWTVTGAYLDRFVDEQRAAAGRRRRRRQRRAIPPTCSCMRQIGRASPRCTRPRRAALTLPTSRPSRSRQRCRGWSDDLAARADARARCC